MHTKTFKIFTLGCKVNQWESAFFRTALEDMGWEEAREDPCGLAIVNTCIVTQKASHQSRQAIRRFIRENPGALVVAAGCYAQVYPEELGEIEGLDMIIGNTLKYALPELVSMRGPRDRPQLFVKPFAGRVPLEPLEVKNFAERTRAYLKVQDGCETFCSYCIVPRARGPYRSLELDHVLWSLEGLADQGFKEVVLTGIHLGKYGVDLHQETDLAGLLAEIGKRQFPLRIRLSSLEPGEINDAIIEMVASEPWLCRHFHVPLQSGDARVLKAMGRTYSPEDYRSLILKIREKVPLAAIGADVMVGFPFEGEKEFQNTLKLAKSLPVSYLHVFPYSPRKGTPAEKLGNPIPPDVVKQRARCMRDLGLRKRADFWNLCVGIEFEVLVEKWEEEHPPVVQGLTDNYLSVRFPSHCNPGEMTRLLLRKEYLDVEEAENTFHP